MLKINSLNYQVAKDTGKKKGFALKNISFQLESGYIMGLLGKNGAGKSTLLKLLCSAIPADSGDIIFHGRKVCEELLAFRQEIAYIGSEAAFFNYRTLQENIQMLGKFYDSFDKNILDEYLTRFELSEKKLSRAYKELSSGEKCKFQLAFSLAHKPKLLLLDEPTANLDAVLRMELMELLQELVAKEKITIIISTHILQDIEEIADYIGVLKEGELVVFDDRETLMEQYGQMDLEEILLSF